MAKVSRYDLVLSVLAALFLAAYAWPVLQPRLPSGVKAACDATILAVWVAFGIDYARRLLAAESRTAWFLRHLPDFLILVLPLLRPLQLLRLVTVLQVISRTGAASVRGRVGLYVGAGSVLLGFVGALAMWDAERGAPEAPMDSFGDALWWAVTTMTTVGYGDTYPVTDTGRWVAAGLMVAGIALLGTVTATIASFLVEAVSREVAEGQQAEEAADARELARVREELAQLRREVAALRE